MPHKKKYTCLIIDDEPLAIKIIQEHLENFHDQMECAGTYTKAIEAMPLLNTGEVDLIFLDINMPSISGIDFLKALPKPPYVIFTTAYREYAIDAFDLNALDYLMKPIGVGRFAKAINKFFASKQRPLPTTPTTLRIKSDKKNYNIPTDTLLYIEGLDNYIKIKTNTHTLICYDSLSNIAQKLDANAFIRIHRSFIINTTKIEHYTSSYIRLDGRTFTIGRNYKEAVLTHLEQ